jgi:hypothetical protein
MPNYSYGIIPCRNNKDRKVKYNQLKEELKTKPKLKIWYENNDILYEYKTTRHELFTI